MLDKPLRGTILVVDPNPSAAVFISAVLQSSGCGVVCAHDLRSGLREARSQRPVLIWLDAAAADPSGVSLYSAIRRDPELRRVPVVMVLDSAASAPKARVANLPAPDACVTRPLAAHTLLATVNHVLRARLSIN